MKQHTPPNDPNRPVIDPTALHPITRATMIELSEQYEKATAQIHANTAICATLLQTSTTTALQDLSTIMKLLAWTLSMIDSEALRHAAAAAVCTNAVNEAHHVKPASTDQRLRFGDALAPLTDAPTVTPYSHRTN